MIAAILALQLAAAAPTAREHVDQALIIGSISASSVALGLTMACTSTGECRELNPIMRKFIGDGPVTATVVKASANGAVTYVVWRATRGKTRTVLLATMLAINLYDAAHDIRQVRRAGPR